MVNSYKATPDIEVLTSNFPIPGYGLVPINAFVIKGSEPVLVDTGAVVESEEFMPAPRSLFLVHKAGSSIHRHQEKSTHPFVVSGEGFQRIPAYR